MGRRPFKPVKEPQRMVSYWKRQWPAVLGAAVFGTAFNAAMPYAALLQGRLIDGVAAGQDPTRTRGQAAVFLAAVAAIQLLRYFKRFFVRRFANCTMRDMRIMLYNSILHRDLSELCKESEGDLMIRAVSDVDICVEGMRKVTTEVFDTGVLMAAYLVSMMGYGVGLTLLSCLFIPVAMALAEVLKKAVVKCSKAARAQTSRVAQLTLADIEQVPLQRENGIEELRRSLYFKELDTLTTLQSRAGVLEGSLQPLYNVIAMLGIVLVLWAGGQKVLNGLWSVGVYTAYIAIFIALSAKASKAAKLFNAYQKAKVSWLRIKPYLTPYTPQDTADLPLDPNPCLQVRELVFCYPGTTEKVIDGLSFSASKGQIIGVTGPVACGKSALSLALSGLYPYSGSVLLGGLQLRELTGYQRSRRIALMSHRPQLLADTLYNNITLGDGKDVSGVLRDVCFEQDLAAMPAGVQSEVGSGGAGLSGGQQARVALARALYRPVQLLILDDPFSAVDRETEKKIIENIKAHYRSCIILLISHRLSAFPYTDGVILLHADRQAEVGTHRQLLDSSALYRTLFRLQAGGEQGREDCTTGGENVEK